MAAPLREVVAGPPVRPASLLLHCPFSPPRSNSRTPSVTSCSAASGPRRPVGLNCRPCASLYETKKCSVSSRRLLLISDNEAQLGLVEARLDRPDQPVVANGLSPLDLLRLDHPQQPH